MNTEVLIVPLLFIAFSVGFLSVCTYCINTARQTRTLGVIIGDSVRGNNVEPQVRIGMDSDMINAFPIVAYSEITKMKVGKGLLECTVCLSEFGDGDSVRLLPKCDHAFHPECIDTWLTNHVTCPICRINLVGEDNKSVESSNNSGAFTQEINHVAINMDERGGGTHRIIFTF